MKSRNRNLARVSVVLPVLNEQAILPSLIAKISSQLSKSVSYWNIVLVNDGSTDASGQIMDDLAQRDSRIQVLHLARNFGHQAAVHAGICQADGDAVIVMDSDGQDAPETLCRMIDHWLEGDDVVYAVRFGRKESLPKRVLFAAFYRILSSMASVDIPRNAGNFGLMDRVIVDQIRLLGENDRYLPGLRSWVGYRQRALPVERLARHDDEPRVGFRGLISLAKTALFSFSRVPLHSFYWLSSVLGVIAFGCVAFASIQTMLSHAGGRTALLFTAMFATMGAIQCLGVAILGEYVARIYDQVRDRPLFIVARRVNTDLDPTNSQSELNTSATHLLQQIEQLRNELRSLQCEGLSMPTAAHSRVVP
jgi:polyisoprenyl-phosphate glycosyltransferase